MGLRVQVYNPHNEWPELALLSIPGNILLAKHRSLTFLLSDFARYPADFFPLSAGESYAYEKHWLKKEK